MRRRSNSAAEDKVDEAQIEKEITEIERHYDFDVPQAIDWDLLIVRHIYFRLKYFDYRKAFNF